MHTYIKKCERHFVPVGRIIIGVFFFLAGVSKFIDLDGTAGYIASVELPAAAALALIVALFEVVAGLALIVGRYTREASVLLAAFTLLAGVLFHGPGKWSENPMEQIMFMKNMAIMGGLLFMAGHLGTAHRHETSTHEELSV